MVFLVLVISYQRTRTAYKHFLLMCIITLQLVARICGVQSVYSDLFGFRIPENRISCTRVLGAHFLFAAEFCHSVIVRTRVFWKTASSKLYYLYYTGLRSWQNIFFVLYLWSFIITSVNSLTSRNTHMQIILLENGRNLSISYTIYILYTHSYMRE